MHRPARTWPCLLLVAAGLVGCGGGGSGSDAPGILAVEAAADGLFRSDFTIDAASPTQRIAVGADGAAFVHGWIRFIHAPTTIALVGDFVVSGVTLEISKVSLAGDPATQHPTVTMRHTNFGDLIESIDYLQMGTGIGGGGFSPTGAGTQTFVFDVTTQVLGDITAGRTYSDFYLETSGVATDNSYWIFEDEDGAATGDEPTLVFRYTP